MSEGFEYGAFSLSFNPESTEQTVTIKLKEACVFLSASDSAEFMKLLCDYQYHFHELRLKALRMDGKVDEAVSMLCRTDCGNRIPCTDYEKGPTQLDLFHSYFLNECSGEWLAEQLNMPLAKINAIWEVWNDDFQERTPETAEKLEATLKEAVGPDAYEQDIERRRQHSKEMEDDHAALIERHKLWGLDVVPLCLAGEAQDTDW